MRRGITYAPIAVDAKHWALHRPVQEDAYFVARFTVYGPDKTKTEVSWKLNPTDSRNLRSIVFISDVDMKSTLNRAPTLREREVLGRVSAIVQEVYASYGLEPQMAIAGNNSHSGNTGADMMIGMKEPSMYHAHIWGRNSPSFRPFADRSAWSEPKLFDLLKNMELGGPKIGVEYNLRGDNKNEPGNDAKRPWTDDLMRGVARAFAGGVNAIALSSSFPSSMLIDLACGAV